MKLDVFNEIQDPRPWTEGHEHDEAKDVFLETMAYQQKLVDDPADRTGAFLREDTVLAPTAELGIDRLMCFHQVGSLTQDQVLTSIRLIGELIPEFDRPVDR